MKDEYDFSQGEVIKGPPRRSYYDMNPWYLKNKDNNIFDWHQHVVAADELFLEAIESHVYKRKPRSILELGSGGGDFTLRYSVEGVDHTAVEFSSVAVQMALSKQNSFGVRFVEGDALDTAAYQDACHDLIIAKDLLHCLVGADRLKFLGHVRSHLSEDGSFLLTTHVGLPLSPEVLRYVDTETRINHLGTRAYLDEADIREEFTQAKFEVVFSESLPGQLMLFHLKCVS